MANAITPEFEYWLDRIDLAAIADPDDKIAECEYFLEQASCETDARRFRWLISAFFNAAYSFFEISSLAAFHSMNDPNTGDPVEDSQALGVLRRYVKIFRDIKRPMYVKTGALHEITKRLYDLRKRNTHHFPISIMIAGRSLPEDFHFGHITGSGEPALAFCRAAMSLIRAVQQELRA